jgi:hypothetical protein
LMSRRWNSHNGFDMSRGVLVKLDM